MPINTLEIPPPTRTSPLPSSRLPQRKPERLKQPDKEQEEFPYGWRYVTKILSNGQEIYSKIPLTLEDSLNPQEDYIVPQRPRHAQCSVDIFDMLRTRYADNPTVGVFYDFIMKWDREDLDEPAPDVAVIPNLKDKTINPGSFSVKQEGTRPCLVIEVVSPSSETDYTRKVKTYEQAGIEEYIIVDPHSKQAQPYYEITGYRLKGNRYQPIKPDKSGCLLSQTTSILFGVSDNKQSLKLKDMKTGEWLLAIQEEKEARLETEAQLEEEKEARLEAEAQLEGEKEARLEEKEARLKTEAQLEEEKEARLEAEAQTKQAQQQIRQLMERLRKLGAEPENG